MIDISKVLTGGVKLEFWPLAKPMNIPHIAVPTTAGTGAEISAAAVFYNEQTGMKCNLLAPFIEADIAVLDANVTLGLPAGLTSSTGMDALTHALEAIVSPTANNFTDAHAFAAAKLIEQNLPTAVNTGNNLDARTNMIQASTMAINAFVGSANAMPVHNCAHAFGAVFHVPHGDANAVLLPVVMEALPELYIPQARRLALALNMEIPVGSDKEVFHAVLEKIHDFQAKVKCEVNFERWEVSVNRIEEILLAIASDPVSLYYPIPIETIRKIALKVMV